MTCHPERSARPRNSDRTVAVGRARSRRTCCYLYGPLTTGLVETPREPGPTKLRRSRRVLFWRKGRIENLTDHRPPTTDFTTTAAYEIRLSPPGAEKSVATSPHLAT